MIINSSKTQGQSVQRDINQVSMWIRLLVIFLLLLCLSCTSAMANSSHTFSNDNWSGKLTDLVWDQMAFDPFCSLDWDHPLWEKVGIKIPSLKLGINIKLGGEGKFDVTIKEANLKEDTAFDTKISENTDGIWLDGKSMYQERFSEGNIFDYLPYKYISGMDMGVFFQAASTAPVEAQGTFRNYRTIEFSINNGVKSSNDTNFEFTSIVPTDPEKDKDIVLFVGSKYQENAEILHINFSILDVATFDAGPILAVDVGTMAGGLARVNVTKNEWEAQSVDSSTTDIHTCTENGKKGCLKGEFREVYENTATFKVRAACYVKVKIIVTLWDGTISLFEHSWPIDTEYNFKPPHNIVQSLTWEDGLKHQENCDHHAYQVPVAVWANKNKTIPVNDVTVYADNVPETDRIPLLTSSKTGKDKSVENPDGKAFLFLPYKDGKYTIKVNPASSVEHVTGSAEQPGNMSRGLNDRVDIVLQSEETEVYNVVKEWDIDFEGNDKPDSIDVLLQAQYYNNGFLSWEGVQKVTLNAGNNWRGQFAPVPKYEMNAKGQMVEIKYRVRELKPEESEKKEEGDEEGEEDEDQSEQLIDGEIADIEVVQEQEGLFHPDISEYAGDSKRVVPSRWDLDNVHVWDVVKKKTTDWNELWQFEPTEKYLKGLFKASVFPQPSVTYKVPEYTTVTGEHVEAHTTKYQVEYETEGTTTTIKNTAMLDISMYKRWIMLGDAEAPDSVYLALCYRLPEAYREHAPGAAQKFTNLWIPVIKPLGGNKINVIELIGAVVGGTAGDIIKWISKLDVFNMVSIPVAVGKASKRAENGNPLTAWQVKFQVKKYNWLLIDGLPVEFEGMELSSTILTDLITFLTGFTPPVSLSFNLSGDLYATVPGKAYTIPYLDKDWERTANIINTWYDKKKDENDEVTSISGKKIWKNDDQDKRPDTLTITIRDGNEEIGTVDLKKNENSGNEWKWTYEARSGQKLYSDKKYTISEGCTDSDDQTKLAKYTCAIDGNDLTNTYNGKISLVIKKAFLPDTADKPESVKVIVKDADGNTVGAADGYTLNAGNNWQVTLTDGEGDNKISLSGKDLNRLVFEETFNQPSGTTWTKTPDVSVQKTDESNQSTYTYTLTNKVREKIKIRVVKEWKNDSPSEQHDAVSVKVKCGDKIKKELELSSDNSWRADTGDEVFYTTDENGSVYTYTVEEVKVPDGYTASVSGPVEITEGNQKILKFMITNTKKAVIGGIKYWLNDTESDRPDSLTVVVKDGDEEIGRTTIYKNSASNNYTDDDGKRHNRDSWVWTLRSTEIEAGKILDPDKNYMIEEILPDGYSNKYSCEIDGHDIRNTLGKKTRLVIRKIFDSTDAAQKPVDIKIGIIDDRGSSLGEYSLSSDNTITLIDGQNGVSLNGKDFGKFAFEESFTQPEGSNWAAKPDVSGPVRSDDDDYITYTYTLTNREIRNVSIVIEKKWQGDKEENRPNDVSVTVLRNGTNINTLNVSKDDGWRGEISRDSAGNSLPSADSSTGKKYVYTVVESSVPGYKGHVDSKVEEGNEIRYTFTITNTPVETVTVKGKKTWDDSDAANRPSSIVIRLMADNWPAMDNNGNYIQKSVSSNENWTWEFQDMPRYDADGNEISYSVIEGGAFDNSTGKLEYLTGYNASYSTPAFDDTTDTWTCDITNSNQTLNISVIKIWDDNRNAEGTRPGNITVKLANDKGLPEQTETLNESNGWLCVFRNLKSNTDAGEVTYTVTEIPVGQGDETVPLKDYGYDTKVLSYPEQLKLSSMNRDHTGNSGVAVVHNALSDTKMSIPVSKVWEGGYEELDIDEVKVTLYRDDDTPVTSISLTKDNSWSGQFFAVDKYEADGITPVKYQVKEELNPAGAPYEQVSIVPDIITCDNNDDGFIITNKYTGTVVLVVKDWENDTSVIQPDEVNFELWRKTDASNSGGLVTQGTLRKEDGWLQYYNVLKNDSAGRPYKYYVKEISQDQEKYRTTYEEQEVDSVGTILRIVNTIVSDYKIEVVKEWDDNQDEYGNRPDTVNVYLLANGKYIRMLQLNEASGWKGEFDNLPLFEEYLTDLETHTPIVYTVEESPVTGYTGTQMWNESRTKVTLKNTPVKMDIDIEKIWNDDDDREYRPVEVYAVLYGNHKQIRKIRLSESNQWKGTAEDVPVYMEGRRARYSVEEENVLPMYSADVDEAMDDNRRAFYIINNLKETTRDITVTKKWLNISENYPEITIHLLSDRDTEGTFTDAAVSQLKSTKSVETYTFKDMPIYAKDGRVVQYQVREDELDGFWEPAYVNHQYDFEINNIKMDGRAFVLVAKVWEDDDDSEGLRPTEVEVRLLRNGEFTGETLTLTEEKNWIDLLSGLELDDENGNRYVYTVQEQPVKWYESNIDGTEMELEQNRLCMYVITNTRIPVKTDIRVTKHWINLTQDYPEITIHLLSDQDAEGIFTEVDSWTFKDVKTDDDWVHVFRDMPIYANDERVIQYQVTEDAVEGFEMPAIVPGKYQFRIFNKKADDQKLYLLAGKDWEDENNAEGLRPETIEVELLQNGIPTGKMLTLSQEDEWTGIFSDLERTDDKGNKYEYSIKEHFVEGYESEVVDIPIWEEAGLLISVVTNTMSPQKYTITYDPNGGFLNGSTEPISSEHLYGEVISISKAPTRSGYAFLYWKGSEYQPGESYTVTEDHMFVAQWETEPYTYSFSFTKKWSGMPSDNISWTLYNSDGEEVQKKFTKTVVSDSEWHYEAWFRNMPKDYYIVEDQLPGYVTQYVNTQGHEETDRCYNGGTIVNINIPPTGASPTHLLQYLVLAVASLIGIGFIIRKNKKT